MKMIIAQDTKTQNAVLLKALIAAGNVGLNKYQIIRSLGIDAPASRVSDLNHGYGVFIDSHGEDAVDLFGVTRRNVSRYWYIGKRDELEPSMTTFTR